MLVKEQHQALRRSTEAWGGCASHHKHLTSVAKPRPLPLAPLGERGRVSRPHWPLLSASISGLSLSEAAVGAGRH